MAFTDADYEAFLQLDDTPISNAVKGGTVGDETRDMFANDLADIRSRREAEAQEEQEFIFDENDDDDYYTDPFNREQGLDDTFIFEDEEGYESEAEEENEEAQEQGEEGTEEAEESTNDEPQYETVNLDPDMIITLPDGSDLTYGEMLDRYQDDSYITAREVAIAQKEQALEDRINSVSDMLKASEAEVFLALQQYETTDWDALYTTDPAEYAAHKRNHEYLLGRRSQIVHALEQQEAKRNYEAEQKYKADCKACVEVLKAKIPEWSEDLYQEIMYYAVTHCDYPEEEIVKVNRPQEFYALYQAMKSHKGREAMKARRVIKASSPSAVTRAGSMSKPGVDNFEAKRKAAAKAYAQGKMSHADVFQYLED